VQSASVRGSKPRAAEKLLMQRSKVSKGPDVTTPAQVSHMSGRGELVKPGAVVVGAAVVVTSQRMHEQHAVCAGDSRNVSV